MRDADNPPLGHLVSHPKRSPQRHLQTAAHSRRDVILKTIIAIPSSIFAQASLCEMLVPS